MKMAELDLSPKFPPSSSSSKRGGPSHFTRGNPSNKVPDFIVRHPAHFTDTPPRARTCLFLADGDHYDHTSVLSDNGDHDDGDHDDGEHEDVGDEDDQLTHHQVGHILSLAPHTPALALDIANESVFQFQSS